MNDTPRTDAQAQTVFTDAGTINAVPQDFARTLERENALLVEHNERMRQALEKADKFVNLMCAAIPFKKQIQDHLPYGLSDEIKSASCEDSIGIRAALNPPPTK